MKRINQVNILGTLISNISYQEFDEIILEIISKKSKHIICIPPVNSIIMARKDTLLSLAYEKSIINTADSVPVMWAANFLGYPIKERIAGMDLFEKVMLDTEKKQISHYFIGGSKTTLEKMQFRIKAELPKLDVKGFYSPPFVDEFDDIETSKMIDSINDAKPDILWVGMTCPKQEKWLVKNIEKLDIRLGIGVGGAFNVFAREIKRAPKWMQRNGFEWFYRFLQEPKRMFSRYFIEAPIFIPLIIKQKFFK